MTGSGFGPGGSGRGGGARRPFKSTSHADDVGRSERGKKIDRAMQKLAPRSKKMRIRADATRAAAGPPESPVQTRARVDQVGM